MASEHQKATRTDPFWPVGGVLFAVSLGAAVYLLGYFLLKSGQPVITGDSIHELADWTRGEPFPARLYHNNVASWTQSLGLYLDVYVGPYAVWSRAMGYLFLVAFCCFLSVATRSNTTRSVMAAFIGVFVLFWFQSFNGAQAYWYLWRQVEVGAQLLTAGLFVFLILRLKTLSPLASTALLTLAFVASSVHIGYVMFFTGLVALIVLETRLKARLVFGGLLLLYTVYMFVFDGTFANLLSRFLAGNDDTSSNTLELVQAMLGLASQFVEITLGPFLPDTIILVVRVLFLIVLGGLMVWTAVRAVLSKRPTPAIFLYVAGSSLLAIVLATVGRFPDYGLGVMAVPRYFSYSLLLFMACVWLGVVSLRPRWSYALLLPVCALGLVHVSGSHKTLTFAANGTVFARSADFTLFLTEDFGTPIMGVDARRQKALEQINPVLIQQAAAGHADPIMIAARKATIADTVGLAECRARGGFKPAANGVGRDQFDLLYEIKPRGRVDFAIAFEGDTPVAVGAMLQEPERSRVRLALPQNTKDLKILLGKFDRGVTYVCAKTIR